MNYIVLDLEWNQPQDDRSTISEPFFFDSEIIEIGAIRLNENFEGTDSFATYVKPKYYPTINSSVIRLTKIRSSLLEEAPAFPQALRSFLDWCGSPCCLCTWGKTDASVLFDNILMHGVEMTDELHFCDLQRIFGRELMKDERQCSLENAIGMMNLPKDRAHDALNDARNTVRICERMNLAGYIDEYRYRYVCYAEDRLRGLKDGKLLPSTASGMDDDELSTMICPYCGETLRVSDWAARRGGWFGYARCTEGDEYLCTLKRRHSGEDYLYSRGVYEMSDDLWDQYQIAMDEGGRSK